MSSSELDRKGSIIFSSWRQWKIISSLIIDGKFSRTAEAFCRVYMLCLLLSWAKLFVFPRTFSPRKVVATCGQDHLRLWWRRTDDKRSTNLWQNPRVLSALLVTKCEEESTLCILALVGYREVNKSVFFCHCNEICLTFTTEDKQ